MADHQGEKEQGENKGMSRHFFALPDGTEAP
jgi:hypothetical protein